MQIEVLPNVTIMKLHGNVIAYRYNDTLNTISITNAGWCTNQTKERLNSIPGVKVHQHKGEWYLNDEPWDGRLVDVNKHPKMARREEKLGLILDDGA